MAFDRSKLINALDKLKKYYGISGIDDLLRTIALESVTATPVNQQNTARPFDQANAEELEILKTIFHDRTSLFSTETIISKISQTATNAEIISRFNKTFQMFNETDVNGMNKFIEDAGESKRFVGTSRSFAPISSIISNPSNSLQDRIINNGTPTKVHPGLSVLLCNTHRLSFNQFYGDLLTIWLNGMPTEELAKSTPFFTIEFNTPRVAVDNQGKLSAMGLNKFIYGAKTTNDGDPFFVTSKANREL